MAIASAKERLRLHHGSASFRPKMAWNKRRCIKPACLAINPAAQPAVTYTDQCTRCYLANASNTDSITEERFQELKRNGAFPDLPAGKGNGAKGGKGKGKDGKGTSKGTSKGKGKGGKGKGKDGWNGPPSVSLFSQQKAEKARKETAELKKRNEDLAARLEALENWETPKKLKPEEVKPDEPKPLMTCNRQGKEVPVIAICALIGKDGTPCNKQHWSIPKSGNCVQCGLVLPVPEEKKINPLLEKTFISNGAKKMFAKLDGFEGPEAEMAEDDRIAMLTKVQALYDQAVSTGISSEALLKPMKDQIEIYKNPNPKTKNSERESSYTLLAQAEGAGAEELRYWDAQKARMDVKVKQLQLKVDKAAEYLVQEKKMQGSTSNTTRRPQTSTTKR